MSATIAQLAHRSLGTLSPAERRAAQTLLANYPLLGLRTVAEFAEAAGVSSPSVLRFVGRLGFTAYADFQERLHGELADQLKAPLQKTSPLEPHTTGDVAAAISRNVAATLASVPASEIDAVVALISQVRRPVLLTGGRFTDPLAAYMATHLALMRPGIVHIGRSDEDRRDRLVDIRKGAVVAVFDIRRYDDGLVRFTSAARDRGAEVILFTDQWLSPVSRVAARVLPAQVETSSVWDSNAGLLAVVELVLAGVARTSWPTTRKRLRHLEALRGRFDEAG